MKKALSLMVFLAMTGCTTSDMEAVSTLRKMGFTNIVTGDTSWYGCSENDKMGREFTAQNPSGETVEGLVCCGNFKRCTVRF